MRFTPGPWKVLKPLHGHATKYRCVQIGTDKTYTTLEVLPSDAHLIATAPELLVMCQRLEQMFPQVGDPFCGGDQQLMHDLRAVIAKAKGESS